MKKIKLYNEFFTFPVPYPVVKDILDEPKRYSNTAKRASQSNNFDETEQYSNIHKDNEGHIIGDCKYCHQHDLYIYGHDCSKKQSNTKDNISSYYDFVLNPARASRDLSEFESIYNDIRDMGQNYSNSTQKFANYDGPPSDEHYRGLYRKGDVLFGNCRYCNSKEVIVSEHNKICKKSK